MHTGGAQSMPALPTLEIEKSQAAGVVTDPEVPAGEACQWVSSHSLKHLLIMSCFTVVLPTEMAPSFDDYAITGGPCGVGTRRSRVRLARFVLIVELLAFGCISLSIATSNFLATCRACTAAAYLP
jgi:hypothetical protein